MGDPVLRTPAQEVTEFDDSLQTLVRDMFETMYAVGGVGLAAPQVGVGLQVFTWGVHGDEGHVVNPRLSVGEEPQDGGEGCLSVPGLSHETPRSQRAVLTGVDAHGRPVQRDATGLLARCFQHETDHLHGMLYVDRLVGEERKDALRRLRSSSFQDTVARTAREREDQRLAATSTHGAGAQDPAARGARRPARAGDTPATAGSAFTRSADTPRPAGSAFTRGGAR